MGQLLADSGMVFAFAIVLVIHGLSLLMLFLNVQIFRSQTEKYRLLLANLGNQKAWGNTGRILLPLYVLITLISTVVTTLIFLFQPHLL